MQKQQPKKPFQNPFETLEHKPQPKNPSMLNIPDMFKSSESIKKADNHSPMDLEKLNKAYANQDQKSLDELRKNMSPEQQKEQEKNQFFRNYKRKEEEYYMKRKQEEEEKKRQEAEEEFQKRQQQQQAEADQQGGDLPQGKVRKNILGGNKTKTNMRVPPPSTVEYKPSKGSQ